MVKLFFAQFFLMTSAWCACAYVDYSLYEKIDEIEARCSKIAVLAAPDGTRLLLKQRNKQDVRGLLMTVIETLGGIVAESIAIHSNHVELVAADNTSAFKFFKGYPATIHSFVPGKTLRHSKMSDQVTLNQRCRKSNDSDCGLTLDIIQTMSLHPDLAPIAALDTFVGNNRHDSNLMYSEKDDRFYSIDYGAAFKVNLARKSIGSVQRLLRQRDVSLSSSELGALEVYRATLSQLIALYPPAILSQKFDDLLERSHIKATMIHKSSDFSKRINKHKRFFQENGEDSLTLLSLLDELISRLNKS